MRNGSATEKQQSFADILYCTCTFIFQKKVNSHKRQMMMYSRLVLDINRVLYRHRTH